MSGGRVKKARETVLAGLVALFIVALAIRDPHGFGHTVRGFVDKLGEAASALWGVISGIASGT